MNFIILGDKYQKGMKSKGCVGLLRFNKKHNIFQHQYHHIKEHFPKAKIIYVHGFESKKFVSFLHKNGYDDVIAINNDEYDNKNQAYSLSLTKSFLNSDCFITFGNTILVKNIFSKFNKLHGSQIFISNDKSEIGCIINDSFIENISFDLDNYISNIYYLDKLTIPDLNLLLDNTKFHNNFLFEIINKLIDAGKIFKPYYTRIKK